MLYDRGIRGLIDEKEFYSAPNYAALLLATDARSLPTTPVPANPVVTSQPKLFSRSAMQAEVRRFKTTLDTTHADWRIEEADVSAVALTEDAVVEVLCTGTIGIIEPDERPEATGATQ